MSDTSWNAPAKVNLTLKVVGRRDDGFHELESLMAPVNLFDKLHFQPAEEFSLHCEADGVPLDESNLVAKAVRVFEKHTSKQCRWAIALEKNIPHGAGLGGGSSDAATTLLALNSLCKTNLPLEKLAELSAQIGSDIPFFIYQQTCQISGRGEIVKPIQVDQLAGTSVLLIKPSFGVSTPDAYKNCLFAEPLAGINYEPQRTSWGEVFNDLEMPVFQKHRFLAEVKHWLLEQPEVCAALMSGSGSTMMAFLQSPDQADAVSQRARAELDPTLWTFSARIG